MGLRNTTEKYGKVAIAIHWIMAIMIITMLFVGSSMVDMPDGDEKWKIYGLHKASGLIVLGLALFRWFWMLTNDKPEALSTWSKAETGISHATKWILMLMLLIMPIAGITMSIAGGHGVSFFGIFTIPGLAEKNEMIDGIFHEIHEIGALVIVVIGGLHILAAIKHHFMDKDNTLNRMLGRNK